MTHAPTTTHDLEHLRAELTDVGQQHLLNFYDELTAEQQRELLSQIAALDIRKLPELVDRYVNDKPAFDASEHSIEPPTALAHDDPAWDRDRFRAEGEALLREGKLAALTVAGGQGSRLGFDGPKGCFPAGPVTNKCLFACLAEWIAAARERYKSPIPWYIMTSPLNDQHTRDFFAQHGHFGLPEHDITFFTQGTMPAFDTNTGRILMASKHQIATSPDGHGGTLKALRRSGALEDMRKRGIEHISYTHVDNPLARVIDPLYIGLHLKAPGSSAQISSKAVAKTEPDEKVGLICHIDGRTGVIEYSDLPQHLAQQTDPDGKLTLRAGNIGIHLIARRFVDELFDSGELNLPFHRAEKNLPCIDPDNGEPLETDAKNAVKLEMFIFDALPKAEGSLVYEVDRTDEFAPIKNADGKDSPATSAHLQTERAARWLEQRGLRIPRRDDGTPDCTLEISPRTAARPEDLHEAALPNRLTPGERLAL